MEIQEIETIISSFKKAGLNSLFLKNQDFELQLGKQDVSKVIQQEISEDAEQKKENRPIEVVTQEEYKTIVAPMVGTFYAAANPSAEPIVKIGMQLKKGDVVCILEAMKLMNEVEADVEGEVIDILVKNEEMVEYGQPLFLLK